MSVLALRELLWVMEEKIPNSFEVEDVTLSNGDYFITLTDGYVNEGRHSLPSVYMIIKNIITGQRFYVSQINKTVPYGHTAKVVPVMRGNSIINGDKFMPDGFLGVVEPKHTADTLLHDNIKQWQKEVESQPLITVPSKISCMQIASTLPNGSFQELIDNTERIMRYLEVAKI